VPTNAWKERAGALRKAAESAQKTTDRVTLLTLASDCERLAEEISQAEAAIQEKKETEWRG